MTRLPDDVVGDAQTSTFGWETLQSLVDVGNRMAGQEGEKAGAAVVADAFEEAGLREVEIDEFDIPGWWRGSSAIELRGSHPRRHESQHDVLALPGSPSGTVSGPVVDVGDGTYEEFDEVGDDLQGAIALVSSDTPENTDRWLHRMEKYVNAADHGAIGFLFRNHIEGSLPPTGEVGYHNRPGPIPAVGVSKEVGERLARYADEQEGFVVELDVDCRNEPTKSRNVEGVLGPADADEEVLVTAHVDAHDIADGANDNGAGSALVAEIGRLLAQVESDLDSRVRFVTFGSEEIGLWGAYHFAESRDLDSVKCVLNVDGPANSRNVRVGTNGFDEMGEAFEAMGETLDVPIQSGDTISPHGDQWAFVQEGVPAVMASSTSDQSGRGWGHTHADTLDKLDPRDLRDVATILASTAYHLASDEVETPHKTRSEIRDSIDAGYVTELKMGGRWPYDDDARSEANEGR
ncbi:M28 family peptidase [Haloprofundus sp. MHR1]|uniref:M28 family peptidase n=1 Tax=Haloprofundus sp. MHR1 TaxID=2572921 RepID=UPI0010BF5024|nr:M28 family peptidase [Haloprofundus sp. MHR1]QCJ45918.1 M28 family peptidase [Haloprofundus sp. MHR1]